MKFSVYTIGGLGDTYANELPYLATTINNGAKSRQTSELNQRNFDSVFQAYTFEFQKKI